MLAVITHPFVRVLHWAGAIPTASRENGIPKRPNGWPAWVSPVPVRKVPIRGKMTTEWVSVHETVSPDDDDLEKQADAAEPANQTTQEIHEADPAVKRDGGAEPTADRALNPQSAPPAAGMQPLQGDGLFPKDRQERGTKSEQEQGSSPSDGHGANQSKTPRSAGDDGTPTMSNQRPEKARIQAWADKELKKDAERLAEKRGESLSELVTRAVRKEVHQQQFQILNDEYNLEEEVVDISRAAAEEATNQILRDVQETLATFEEKVEEKHREDHGDNRGPDA